MSHCEEGIEEEIEWRNLCGGLGFSNPNVKRLTQDQKGARAQIMSLFGAFVVYWSAIDVVARFQAVEGWKKKLSPRVPSYRCGVRKIVMKKAITAAREHGDWEEVMRLRRLCAYYQADELVQIYSGYIGDICGALPGLRDRKFSAWLKELVRRNKVEISGSGWKKVVWLIREY